MLWMLSQCACKRCSHSSLCSRKCGDSQLHYLHYANYMVCEHDEGNRKQLARLSVKHWLMNTLHEYSARPQTSSVKTQCLQQVSTLAASFYFLNGRCREASALRCCLLLQLTQCKEWSWTYSWKDWIGIVWITNQLLNVVTSSHLVSSTQCCNTNNLLELCSGFKVLVRTKTVVVSQLTTKTQIH